MTMQPDRIDLARHVRTIPDFPKPGIVFRDITPLLGDPAAFRESVVRLADLYADREVDLIAAVEARGFLFAAPMATILGVGLVPIRKPGKLPYSTVAVEYDLEYGKDRLEMHSDAFRPGQRVLVVDDVLATGGTMKACCELVQSAGAQIVGCAFVIELGFLRGRERLTPHECSSLLTY
jgi:adenine phosphoribosyltransferase